MSNEEYWSDPGNIYQEHVYLLKVESNVFKTIRVSMKMSNALFDQIPRLWSSVALAAFIGRCRLFPVLILYTMHRHFPANSAPSAPRQSALLRTKWSILMHIFVGIFHEDIPGTLVHAEHLWKPRNFIIQNCLRLYHHSMLSSWYPRGKCALNSRIFLLRENCLLMYLSDSNILKHW